MLLSNKAKILIQPRLYLNEIPAPLDILKDTEVTITSTNENAVPSTITFDQLKFTHKEELELEFPITGKIQNAVITVTGKVKKMNNE